MLLTLFLVASASLAHAQSATPDSIRTDEPALANHSFWLARAQEGSLLREDRFQHATLSASLVIGASCAGAKDGQAAGTVLSVGVLKEIFDWRRGSGASRLDLLADVLGVGLGLLIVNTTR